MKILSVSAERLCVTVFNQNNYDDCLKLLRNRYAAWHLHMCLNLLVACCCRACLYAYWFLYTGGPYPIAYSPFGEIVSGAVMGMGIVLIAFYIQTLTVTLDAVLLSVPSMILVGAIMLSNNIRDIVGDTEGGRRTLAILVGRDNAISVLSGFLSFHIYG